MQPHQSTLNRLHQKLGASPLILFFLGALALIMWACGTIVQIQTSEYLALGVPTRVAGVAWSVVQQPALLLTGQAPAGVATAWMFAWVVETVTLIFALVLSVAVAKISAVNRFLAKGFVVGAILLIALNSWADYSSSPGSNPLVQFLIALAIGMVVVVGPPLGVGLIEHAV